MIGKNNKQMIDRKNGTRVESYAIKKFKVGTASVAVGAMIFLGTFISNGNEAHAKDDAPKTVKPEVVKEVVPASENVVQKTKEVAKPVAKVEETTKPVQNNAEVVRKVEEKPTVDMSRLKSSLQNAKTALQKYTLADQSVVSTVREQINVAEGVLQAGHVQSDVDNMVATLDAVSQTLRESHAQNEVANRQQETHKSVSKEVETKKNELTKTISEAEVTNTVAKDVLRKQKIEDNARVNVELAVNKNEIAITDANTVMVNEKASKTQIENSLINLGSTITNVYKALENTGINNFTAVLSATEGYTYETTEKRHENGEFVTATGKSYQVLDGNSNYKIYVKGYQSENTERPSKVNEIASTGGRTDIPLSKGEAQKLSEEAPMWVGKPRITGKANGSGVATYGAGGSYEFLATEIYGYAYEQGKHYVYVTDVKNRFSLSQEAQDAGYRITDIELSNLAPGLGYNEKMDTIEGYISSSLQNGVYDMRYSVTVTKPDGTTTKVSFRDLRAGWMGWQDTTPPTIEGSSTIVKIGDTVSHDLKYLDNPGMLKDDRANYQYGKHIKDPKTNETIGYEDNQGRVGGGSETKKGVQRFSFFTTQDGSRVRTETSPVTVTAHTTLNGIYTGKETPISDVLPGLSYDPQTGLITGTTAEAGIFTMAAQAKDYNNATNAKNQDWNAYGQEAHENITIAVTPKITVSNVEAYSTSLPVTISNGANIAEVTTPDGKVTRMAVKNGKWVVAEGTTNPAVTIGAELGDASTTSPAQFNLAVTSDATQYVGVDNIVARATTDKIRANLQREVVTVRDADGNTHIATFNRATGKFQLPNEEAYVVTDNADGTTTLKERRVYTDLKADGDIDYIVYEFTRTWTSSSTATNLVDKVEEIRKNGKVNAVGDVTRTVTTIPKDQTSTTDGVIVTVTYDSVSKTWSASDGSAVKATASNAGWSIETSSGFKGYVTYRSATGVDVSSIQNAKPAGTSTSYTEEKGVSVDLHKSSKANVGFTDVIDDKSDDAQSETIVTKLTVVAPDGTTKVFDAAQTEERAYIQAQRTQAEKAKLAADAVKNLQDARNDLARLQELLDRQEQFVDDAQKALDNLKLRTISITAKELAEDKLQKAKEYRTELQTQLANATTSLPGVEANVETTRQAVIQAQEAVEIAREALKVAAKANMENPELKNYLLDKYGRYKVSVHSVDSNGIVTTPTIGGNDSGEITEDAVADTTYYIAVSAPERSSGIQGAQQTGNMADKLAKGQPENTTLSEYKLIDPETQADVTTVTTSDGVYTIDSTTGNVTFTPNADFVGNAKPVKVSAIAKFPNEEGSEVSLKVSNTYTPTVYGLDNTDDTTIDKQGNVQHSITGLERFGRLNTTENTPDGTNVNMNTAVYTLDGADSAGAVVVKGQGKYAIDGSTGVVTFTPEPQFIGKTSGVRVNVSATALDIEGKTLTVTSSAIYTPEVTPVTPTGEDVKTIDKQGKVQTGTPTFTEGDPIAPITITEEQPAKFIVNGQPTDEKEIPATKDGKEIGKYKIDPLTGVVTFTPKPEFVGTVDGVTVQVKDKNGTPANGKYTPEVPPVTPTGEDVKTIDKQGTVQTGTPTF
ncbi:MAG: YSIRK-type signal peptide-containing protein, partial [Veillonella parvula]